MVFAALRGQILVADEFQSRLFTPCPALLGAWPNTQVGTSRRVRIVLPVHDGDVAAGPQNPVRRLQKPYRLLDMPEVARPDAASLNAIARTINCRPRKRQRFKRPREHLNEM